VLKGAKGGEVLTFNKLLQLLQHGKMQSQLAFTCCGNA
jgi:hypothetical protein